VVSDDLLDALDSAALANMAADHFQTWIKVQPSDDEIKTKLDRKSVV